MKTKEYNITLKSSWKDISIGEYQQITRLGDDIKNTEFIAILSNLTKEETQDLSLEVIESIMEEFDFFFDSEPPVSPIEPLRTQKYEWELLKDVKQMTASQFIDLVELTKDKDKITDNLHLIISTIVEKKKIGWLWNTSIPYRDRDIMEDAKYIQKHFPINHALSMSSFFLTILETSQINIEDYLEVNN